MMGGVLVGRLLFSHAMLFEVAKRNDPKCPAGWHVKYAARVERDMAELRRWLPQQLTSVLDIGCGFAGIDVLLSFAGPIKRFYLIDGICHGERVAGFQKSTVPWNDVNLAAQLLRDNVVCDVTAMTVPPPLPQPVDLVISLKSWGHHYPVAEYLDFVHKSLRTGGVLILDIRKETTGHDELKVAGFKLMGRAGGTAKCDRLVFQK